MSKHVLVTFHMEPDDLDHETGVTEETFLRVSEQINTLGGESPEFELVDDE